MLQTRTKLTLLEQTQAMYIAAAAGVILMRSGSRCASVAMRPKLARPPIVTVRRG